MNDFEDIIGDKQEQPLSQNENDEIELEQWKTLIGEIVKGNVIPVIGPDILIDRIHTSYLWLSLQAAYAMFPIRTRQTMRVKRRNLMKNWKCMPKRLSLS